MRSGTARSARSTPRESYCTALFPKGFDMAHRYATLTAEEAASLIQHDQTVGFSGFTPAGAPKAIPTALAARAEAEHDAGRPFQIGVLTGASTGPSLDGALAKAQAIRFRTPYQSDPNLRS